MPYQLALVLWLAISIWAGATGLTSRFHPPAPQILVFVLTGLLFLTYRSIENFHAWIEQFSWRQLVAVHLLRFVGLYFLWLCYEGQLPPQFAITAGIGDSIIAASALVLLMRAQVASYGLLLIWNVFGLIDILLVVFTAAAIGVIAPQSMRELLNLPLSILPTFLVPIIIFIHIIILERVRHPERMNHWMAAGLGRRCGAQQGGD
jgi:hypothetical protein